MKKSVEVTIMGHKFMVRADSNEEYVREVAEYVNVKVNEIVSSSRPVASLNVAILAAMNVTDEYFKYKQKKEESLGKVTKRVDDMIELINLHV